MAPECSWHSSVGASPATNTSRRGSGHPSRANRPVTGQMFRYTTPVGLEKSCTGRPSVAAFMMATQAGSAATEPLILGPIGLRSSNPIHTPVTTSGV